MARQVRYTFKGKTKTIPFSYTQHHDLYEAAAEAEGIDLTSFLQMERQIALASKKGIRAERDYRRTEFITMGFTHIHFAQDDEQEENNADN